MYQFNSSQPPHLPLPTYALMELIFTMCFLFNIVTNLNNNCLGQFSPTFYLIFVVKLGISPGKLQKSVKVCKIGNMATNTSDIAYPSDSDDSEYHSEIQNVAQQLIHFIDSNVPSSGKESLNNDSSDNKSVDSENS